MRPSYHDVLDADAGYVRGAQIQFFDTAIWHYNYGATRLERFLPADILSLAPRDDFFQPRSWRVSGGWRRSFLADGTERLVPGLDGGAGAAWGGERGLLYVMGEAGARVHHELEHGYDIGVGGRAGALFDPAPRWRVHVHASGLNYFAGERDTPRSIALEQRLALGRDSALRFELGRSREADRHSSTGSLSLQLYF